MARDRFQGRHRVSRKAKLTTGGIGLAVLTVGALAVFTTTGSPPQASADNPDQSQFVDITTVEPNVNEPDAGPDASTGTFTVDCGRNENGHFNPDNFIAQPGVRNGAQHLHDYVGNLSTDADSNNQSLQAAGTTCANGDKSAYFWPVVRIDTEGDSEEEQQQDNAEEAQAEEAGRSGNQNQDGRQAGQGRNGQNDDQGQAGDNQDQQGQDGQGQNGGQGAQGQGDNQQGQGDQGQAGDQGDFQGQQGQNQQGQDQDGQGQQDQDQQGQGQNEQGQGQQGQGDNNNQGDNNQGDQGQGGNEDEELPAQDENGELPGNEGEIQRPSVVDITFRGSPVTEVEAMPKFLRVLYGDAKVSTNGPANAQESWTCTGFEDQVRIDKYTICPEGSNVMRVHDFPSCWDGQNIDSENHRDHIVYPNENGQCENGFTAVPQLRISLTYEIPREVQLAGQYKVDAFPEEDHNPLSDHDDFANVMSNAIMTRVVDCINSGRTCNE